MVHLISQDKVTSKSKRAIEAYNSGLQSYSLHYYPAAIKHLLAAIEADPQFLEAYLVLAEVYEDSDQPTNAIKTYQQAVQLNHDYYPYAYIRLGNLEYKEGLYEDALESYQNYLKLDTDNTSHIEKARNGISRCKFSIHAVNHPVDFKPVNLGPNVNTTADEYWPGLSADEQTLVITRLVKSDEYFKKVQEDFYISQWQGDGWGEMKNAGPPLNTADNEGAQTLTGDGRYMVFTACNRSDGLGRCDLYYSVKEGDKWSVPKNLGKPVNTSYRETQPSLSSDGRTLYFSSDRPGGQGLHDIWVSHRDEYGQWSQPENLGDSVNTSGVEMSPFIHPDNQSLYFSSDGHIGLGGYDLFVARRDSTGKWQHIVNLGYPINTNRDEIGMIVNAKGDKAYFASDIDKKNGKDIFVFDMPLDARPITVTYMKGKVFDASSGKLLKARFELIDLETDKDVYSANSDSITGEFLVSIPSNCNYMLNVSRSGYLFYSDNFSLKGRSDLEKPFLKDVPLQPIEIGKSTVLKNVFFETDSYALKEESKVELNKVVRFLLDNPNIRIEISGHTDSTGNPEYNQKLSENRAKAVADYLTSSAITQDRIVSKGYGLNVPVADNETEEGRAQNRRTELKIIE
jgi:outer membrane protein OmpA-like peptidoglycan-associated protein